MPGNDVLHPIHDRWGRLLNFDFCSKTAPTETHPYMAWIDPGAQTLKVRDEDDAGWITIGGAGGGGAPPDAQYLVLALDGDLSAERRLVAGDGLQAVDGGPNGDFTLSVDVSAFAGDGLEDDGFENLRVDSTVVRTSGNQTIAGEKTFQDTLTVESSDDHTQLIGKGIVVIRYHNTDGYAPYISFRRYKGTEASPIAVDEGTYLGKFDFQGHDGSSYDSAARFSALVDGSVSSTTVPTAFIIETGTWSDDLTERLRVGSAGRVGIGGTSSEAHLYVEDATLNTITSYASLATVLTKTDGATDEDDFLYGLYPQVELNDSDSTVGSVYGGRFQATLTAGTIGTVGTNRNLFGGYGRVVADGGTLNGGQYGFLGIVLANAGTITGNVAGLYASVDIDAAMTSLGGDVYGTYVMVDDDQGAAGTVYLMYLAGYTGVDYGIYQNGTFPNHLGGSLNVVGNLTSGGSDPPYLLYWGGETRDSVTERVRRGVPPSRLDGLVVFFNSLTESLELYRPSTGQFYEVQAIEVEKRPAIVETFDPETSYYLDERTGQIEQMEHPVMEQNFRIKRGYELDTKTGEFWALDTMRDVPCRDRRVSYAEAVESLASGG